MTPSTRKAKKNLTLEERIRLLEARVKTLEEMKPRHELQSPAPWEDLPFCEIHDEPCTCGQSVPVGVVSFGGECANVVS